MLLSHVICVTHYTGFPFGSASFTGLLCCFGTVFSALQELCHPVSTLVGCRALHSSSGGKLFPHGNTSTVQRCAFSVVAPSIWNSVSSQIRLLPKSRVGKNHDFLKKNQKIGFL